MCSHFSPCYFLFLLLVGISFPGGCTSTLPNKARYPLLNSFTSEEGCRLLFLVIIITGKISFLGKVANKMIIIDTS